MIQEVAEAHFEEEVGYFFNLEAKGKWMIMMKKKKNIVDLNSMDRVLKLKSLMQIKVVVVAVELNKTQMPFIQVE
jgi:hypothetical protein